MHLSVNGKHETSDCKLLGEWIKSNLQNSKGIAIAINETVIPRSKWDSFELQDECSILVVQASQGG